MNTKILLLLLLLWCTKYRSSYSQVNSLDENPIVFPNCTTPEKKVGYCVSIYNCRWVHNIRNISSIITWRCGPRNEQRNNPKVCCEINLITLKATTEEKSISSINTTSVSCGVQNIETQTRIVGGENSSPGEFPWMARLLRKNSRDELDFSCTGALISPNVILTTAHCLQSRDLDMIGQLYAVALGEHEMECSFGNRQCLKHKKTVLVSQTIIHPNYIIGARNHDNDIGLIILKENVELSNYIVPICLPESNYPTNQYFLSGWGATERGAVSTVKKKITLPPFSWEECANKFNSIGIKITKNQICAGGLKGRDSCQGDSGGPLMVVRNRSKWFAAGLVSFGLGCGKEGWPAIYTNVSNYINWITSAIAETAL